ncbi:protein of unknown function [Magnetospirillum sp. XM-1]|nr:protein of unknown function [Magnetospirillum sp. XM-1]
MQQSWPSSAFTPIKCYQRFISFINLKQNGPEI